MNRLLEAHSSCYFCCASLTVNLGAKLTVQSVMVPLSAAASLLLLLGKRLSLLIVARFTMILIVV